VSKRVISLFAGVGGFDLGFERAGFQIVAHVEKDEKCRELLRSKWPDAISLDDVCTAGKHNLPECDVITFGFPCQDLSVAGKRAGLTGKRSGLFYEATRIIDELKPTYCIFENVPGLLSSNDGKDFANVLDAITDIGYCVDVNVLDAQYFGVAQRRRRVFGLCTRADSLRKMKTYTSATILMQWVCEVLLTILKEASPQFVIGRHESVASGALCADGLLKKMKLFGITSKKDWNGLFCDLIETMESFQKEYTLLDLTSRAGLGGRCITNIDQSEHSVKDGAFSVGSISKQWSIIWDERFASQNASTILTALKQTTGSKICSCAEIAATIAWYTVLLKNYLSSCLQMAELSLITHREFTRYARQAINELFTEPSELRCHSNNIFFDERCLCNKFGSNSGAERCAEILSISESLRGHPAPSREAGKVSPCLAASGVGAGRTGNERNEVDFCIEQPLAGTLDHKDATDLVVEPVAFGGDVARTLNARHDSSPCADRGMDVVAVPVAFRNGNSAQSRSLGESENLSPTIPSESGGNKVCVALQPGNLCRKAGADPSADAFPTLGASTQGDQAPHVAIHVQAQSAYPAMQVRRLTARECERLQNFQWKLDGPTIPGAWQDEAGRWWSPDWTAGFADSTRYKMMGNAVCVAVSEWIARRMAAAIDNQNGATH
jgi:site-specific DNA-cytosine methylase